MAMVAVIGTTTWGTALGIILARKGVSIRLWARSEREAFAMNSARSNAIFLPGITFPKRMTITHSLPHVLRGIDMVIMAVPSQTMRTNVRLVAKHLEDNTIVLSVSKGLERNTALRMSQVISEEIKPINCSVCALSGPNLAKEIVHGLPATSTVACTDEFTAMKAQKILSTRNFCVSSSTDIIGVELGGSLKNIIALAAGLSDGLGLGDNARAALITKGMGEITELAVAAGAQPQTLYGPAGWGDLVVTCSSVLSRNHFVGLELSKGRSLKSITHSMKNIAEGVPTTVAARLLAEKCGVQAPMIELIYNVLYNSLSPKQALLELLGFPAKRETALSVR